MKKEKIRKELVLCVGYLVLWSASVGVFWLFTPGSAAMDYALVVLSAFMPALTFCVSCDIGRNDMWGKWKWAGTVVLGIMCMLAEYLTLSLANNIAFGKLNWSELGMILTGAMVSLLGMWLGYVLLNAENGQN